MMRGKLYIWPQRRLFFAPAGLSNAPHAHPALSLIIALDGQFQLEIANDQPRTVTACLLAPRCQHRLEATGVPLLVLHADLNDHRLASLLALFQGHRLLIPEEEHGLTLKQIAAQIKDDFPCCRNVYAFTDTLLDTWTDARGESPKRDPRVAKCLRLIENTLPESVSVEDLAFSVDLSSTRLMHLFKKEVGMPVRRFVLWARLRGAVNALQDEASLTDAAHAMGFSDSAHLSRTFSQMFGIPPSQVLSHNRFVQAHFCENPLD
jgi:AraC-like DNA-binding protein